MEQRGRGVCGDREAHMHMRHYQGRLVWRKGGDIEGHYLYDAAIDIILLKSVELARKD